MGAHDKEKPSEIIPSDNPQDGLEPPRKLTVQENLRRDSDRKLLLIALLLITIFLVLFRNKPFHIDDVYFLEIAENILKRPMDPFHGATTLVNDDFRVFRNVGKTPNTFEAMSHPPLVGYVQAAAVRLSGGFQESSLHLTFMIFPLLCVLSTYCLAKRFTDYPFASTLLFVTSPLFLVNATSVMTDIPMLGLGLTGFSFFIYGIDRRRILWLILAGIFTGLAILTRYVAVGLILLYLSYILFQRKSLTQLLWLLGPTTLIVGLWLLENWLHHGTLHLLASSKHYAHFYKDLSFAPAILLQKLVSGLAAIGGGGVFAFFYLLFGLPNRKRVVIWFIAGVTLSIVVLILRPFDLSILSEYSSWQTGLLFLFFSIGSSFLFLTFPRENESHDKSFLLVWLFGAIITSILMLPFGTGRYMLPALLPLIFVLISGNKLVNKVAATAVVSLTLSLSILLTIADYQHALAYKSFAHEIKSLYPGAKIWFVGDWGFRYYMNRNGCRYLLSTDDSPTRENLIVKAEIAGLHNFSSSLRERCSLVRTIEISNKFPVRLMNVEARTGFYAHGFGFLPFGFSQAPMERFTIYRVDRLR